MDHCCDHKADELSKLSKEQSKVLWIVMLINFAMFVVEFYFGQKAVSSSLTADSLDMLGDAFIFGLSIYAIKRSNRVKSRVSFLKGMIMFLFASAVLLQIIARYLNQSAPVGETMSQIAALAFLANFISAAMLLRYRNADINMRSTWLCSRNDVLANLSVVVAGILVHYLNSNLPDLILGLIMVFIVINSSYSILKESYKTIRVKS
jgi:cation diffusion facilitator family transporter